MRKAYLIISLLFMFIATITLYLGSELPDSRRGVPGPAVWPILISFGILVSSIIVFVKNIKNTESEPLDIIKNDNARVYITMGILIAYFIIMNLIGFVISSLVLMFGLFTWYGNFSIIKRVTLSIAIISIVYGVFNYALNVPFRFGILF